MSSTFLLPSIYHPTFQPWRGHMGFHWISKVSPTLHPCSISSIERTTLFDALATIFWSDTVHIVCGDFSLSLDPVVNQADLTDHHLLPGRMELLHWLICLHLIDPWRVGSPSAQLFSGPWQLHRQDYWPYSLPLFDHHLQDIRYQPCVNYHHEDHHSNSFLLFSLRPTLYWLVHREVVLLGIYKITPFQLIFIKVLPGCLLDEHKRCDSM